MEEDKLKNIKEQIAKIEAEMEGFEKKSPGRDRVVSLQVRLKSLYNQLNESLENQ